jgi:hypothetical protein
MAKTDKQKLADTLYVVQRIGASANEDGIIGDFVYGDHDNDYLDALILYGWVEEIQCKRTANEFKWVGPTSRFSKRAVRELNEHVERIRAQRTARNKKARRPPKYQPPERTEESEVKKKKKKEIDVNVNIEVEVKLPPKE